MRSFSFDDLVTISDLDEAEVERLVADPGFPLYGPVRTGPRRAFVAPDLFNLGLAGALRRLGLALPAIRDVVASLGRCETEPSSGLPNELFPGQRQAAFGPHLIVVRAVGAQAAARFAASHVAPSELWAGVTAYDAGASLVVDATALAERIAAAVD